LLTTVNCSTHQSFCHRNCWSHYVEQQHPIRGRYRNRRRPLSKTTRCRLLRQYSVNIARVVDYGNVINYQYEIASATIIRSPPSFLPLSLTCHPAIHSPPFDSTGEQN